MSELLTAIGLLSVVAVFWYFGYRMFNYHCGEVMDTSDPEADEHYQMAVYKTCKVCKKKQKFYLGN